MGIELKSADLYLNYGGDELIRVTEGVHELTGAINAFSECAVRAVDVTRRFAVQTTIAFSLDNSPLLKEYLKRRNKLWHIYRHTKSRRIRKKCAKALLF